MHYVKSPTMGSISVKAELSPQGNSASWEVRYDGEVLPVGAGTITVPATPSDMEAYAGLPDALLAVARQMAERRIADFLDNELPFVASAPIVLPDYPTLECVIALGGDIHWCVSHHSVYPEGQPKCERATDQERMDAEAGDYDPDCSTCIALYNRTQDCETEERYEADDAGPQRRA